MFKQNSAPVEIKVKEKREAPALHDLRVTNFEYAEALEFDLSDEEVSRGVSFNEYPVINETYQSLDVIAFSEYLGNKAASTQMRMLKDQSRRPFVQKINPFKQDAFSLGMIFL